VLDRSASCSGGVDGVYIAVTAVDVGSSRETHKVNADLLIGTATSLGGVVVGWGLSQVTAAKAEKRLVVIRRAQQELEAVGTIAQLVGALQPNVYLTPIHRGQLIAALDTVPDDRLPLTRAWTDGDGHERARLFDDLDRPGTSDDRESLRRVRVRNELRKEIQRLVERSATGTMR
jgi:hypothetical protein